MIHFDSEKDMEDMFMKYDEHLCGLLGLGECVSFRQVTLGDYGISDILLIDKDFPVRNKKKTVFVNLVELKNDKLSHSHISQCARYGEFFKELNERQEEYHFQFRASLICLKTFPINNDLVFLAQSIEWLDFYELSIVPDEGVSLNIVGGWKRGDFKEAHFNDFMASVRLGHVE